MTKADQTREQIDALVAQGMTKADAFRTLAEQTTRPIKSLQGAYYQATRKANGGSTRPRKRETTPTDVVASAKALLAAAIDDIDVEIEAARERAEEAKAEYDAMRHTATARKQQITTKIKALDA